MKKALLLILILVIVVFGYYQSQRTTPLAKTKQFETAQTQPTKKRISLKSTKYSLQPSSLSRSTFPTECSKSLSDLVGMTIEDYKDITESNDAFIFFLGEECANKLKTNGTFLKLAKSANCSILLENRYKKTDFCLSMILPLRAYLISEATRDKAFEQMNGQELAARFIKMFSEFDTLDKAALEKNRALLDSLIEMYPNDPDLLEAYLGYLMIGKQITQTTTMDELIRTKLDESFGQSFKLDRLHVLENLLKNELESANEKLDLLDVRYPNEPDVSYFRAATAWKDGDVAKSHSYLNRAIELSKNCQSCSPAIYKNTLSKLQKAKPGDPNLFAISIGLNFDDI